MNGNRGGAPITAAGDGGGDRAPEFLRQPANRSEFLDEERAEVITKRWKNRRGIPSTRSLVRSTSSRSQATVHFLATTARRNSGALSCDSGPSRLPLLATFGT